MFIALYINCIRGKFIPYGPFDSEAKAWGWVDKQEEKDGYSVFRVENPHL